MKTYTRAEVEALFESVVERGLREIHRWPDDDPVWLVMQIVRTELTRADDIAALERSISDGVRLRAQRQAQLEAAFPPVDSEVSW